MASGIPPGAIFEVRNVADFSGASDTNGGFFVVGTSGTDYSYASLPATGAAKYALTGLTSSGAGNVLLTSSASADMVGNGAYCVSGTNANSSTWYSIASVVVGTSITFTTNLAGTSIATGVASAVAINIGGCLATPGVLSTLMTVALQNGSIKRSTTQFSLTTVTPGSGGPLAFAAVALNVEGYDQTRGDRTGNKPLIAWASLGNQGSLTYIVQGAAGSTAQRYANIAVDGANANNVAGFSLNRTPILADECTAQNFNGTAGVGYTISGLAFACIANTCLVGYGGSNVDCEAISCGTACNAGLSVNLVTSACGTTGVGGTFAVNCTADGMTAANARGITASFAINSIASGATNTGAAGFSSQFIIQSAAYNNTSNVTGTPLVNEGTFASGSTLTSLSGQPYVTPGSQFAPNSTAGAGASLRGAAIGAAGQTDNKDIGAVQHADPSGGNTYIFQVEG